MSLYGHSFNDFRTQTNNDIVEAHTDKPAHECGACRGSGWWLSDYDTWERCPLHYTGQPDPESAWADEEAARRASLTDEERTAEEARNDELQRAWDEQQARLNSEGHRLHTLGRGGAA